MVAPAQLIWEVCTALMTGGAEVGESITRLLKLVSQPFELAMVTGEQLSVQPVGIVSSCPTATVICLETWPGQLSVRFEATVPPL